MFHGKTTIFWLNIASDTTWRSVLVQGLTSETRLPQLCGQLRALLTALVGHLPQDLVGLEKPYGFPCFSLWFSIGFPCFFRFSIGFPVVFIGFPVVFHRFSTGFPCGDPLFSIVFPLVFDCVPWVFHGFSMEFSMVFQIYVSVPYSE